MAQTKEWMQAEGTFSLTMNPERDKPTKSGKANPTMTGQVMIHGVLYELSAWSKTAASGNRWLSGTIKPPYATQSTPANNPHSSDDVPF